MLTGARLGLLAKWPRPGAVKTRLTPPLTPDEAARLHAAFVADLMRTLETVDAERWLFLDRQDDPIATHGWPGWPVKLQRGNDLGQRLDQASRDLSAGGIERFVLIGADHPTLPARLVEQALIALEHADLVLGPTIDGGYYLIGLRRPRPRLFAEIPWSTPDVLGVTLEHARELALRVAALDPWYDVDGVAGLELVRRHLRLLEMAGDQRCPRSREFLQTLAPVAGRPRGDA